MPRNHEMHSLRRPKPPMMPCDINCAMLNKTEAIFDATSSRLSCIFFVVVGWKDFFCKVECHSIVARSCKDYQGVDRVLYQKMVCLRREKARTAKYMTRIAFLGKSHLTLPMKTVCTRTLVVVRDVGSCAFHNQPEPLWWLSSKHESQAKASACNI